MSETEKLLTIGEVAALASVTERTIWHWIKVKGLPSVKLGGTRRISTSDLEIWIKGNKEVCKIMKIREDS